MSRRLWGRLTAGLALMSLAGCSGEPGSTEIKQAMRNNQRMVASITMMLRANEGLGGPAMDIDSFFASATVEKGNCAAANGASGFVCDIRMSGDAGGQHQAGPWSKARLYQADGTWQIEQLQ